MKLKVLGMLAALALGASAAHATSTSLGTLGPTIATSGGFAAGVGSTVDDEFAFSLTALSTVQSSVSNFLGGITGSSYSVYSTGADHLVGTADDVFVSSHGFTAGNFDTLAAGSYFFKVTGTSSSQVAAYSIGAAATAVPVPEPETYAMLGAGLAAIGFIVSRRRRD